MSKLKDLTGMKFGRLTVIERVGSDNTRNAMWRCKCDCGVEKFVQSGNLQSGNTKSCGCSKQRTISESHTTHGKRSTPIYNIWQTMKARCLNPKNKAYKNYGGRGITVYSEWIDNFQAFCDYVSTLEHFGEEGYTLDRVDNNGNYAPNNLRWADIKTQCRNRRSNVIVEYAGKKMTLTEASEKSGINKRTLGDRFKRGDTGDYLFRPVKKR